MPWILTLATRNSDESRRGASTRCFLTSSLDLREPVPRERRSSDTTLETSERELPRRGSWSE